MSNKSHNMITELLNERLAAIAQGQLEHGLGPVPAPDMDELLLQIAQLPHDRIRGLVVFAAIDNVCEHGNTIGMDVQYHCAGTGQFINALAMAGMQSLMDETRKPASSDATDELNQAGIPPHSEMGGLMMLAAALGRRRRGGRLF